MMRRSLVLAVAIAVFVCSSASTSPAQPVNFLDAYLIKYPDGGGGVLYDVELAANKVGAGSGQLTTPMGSYPLEYCADLEGWEPAGETGTDFWDDHEDLSWAELTTRISSDWTLTWDSGLGTETVCSISFPGLTEGDWFALPVVTYPTPADSPTPANLTIYWSWAGSPSDPDLEEVWAWVETPSDPGPYLVHESGPLAKDATSWTPPELTGGDWETGPVYSKKFAEVPTGLTVSGDPWPLPNGEPWLYLDSDGWSEFTVIAIPGDTQPDGCVDGLDYNTWSLNYLATGQAPWSAGGYTVGNFNEDDVVDGLDYNLWSLNYLSGCGAGAEVPEPAALALLGLGAVALILRRRQ